MNLQALFDQCDAFMAWARQYPLMWNRIQARTQRMVSLVGVPGSTACMEMRDHFHFLFIYANEGGFDQIATQFYSYYVEYCRLLLVYGS